MTRISDNQWFERSLGFSVARIKVLTIKEGQRPSNKNVHLLNVTRASIINSDTLGVLYPGRIAHYTIRGYKAHTLLVFLFFYKITILLYQGFHMISTERSATIQGMSLNTTCILNFGIIVWAPNIHYSSQMIRIKKSYIEFLRTPVSRLLLNRLKPYHTVKNILMKLDITH